MGNIRGLFVTDLDGTLLTDNKTISDIDLRTLSHLQKSGFLTVIATGRSDYSFFSLLESLGFSGGSPSLPVDYVIFSTGAGIMMYPTKRLLKSFSLQQEDVLVITQYLNSLSLNFMVHQPVPDTKYFLYSSHGHENDDFHRRLKIYSAFARPFSKELEKGMSGATEVLCIVPRAKGHDIAAMVAQYLTQFSVIKATSPLDGESVWIEIFPPMVSKSMAVQWLIDNIGLSRENVCAVGNDYNDEDLLHWAGYSFVVANSPSTMLIDFSTVAYNNENGVSEAARRWLDTIKE